MADNAVQLESHAKTNSAKTMELSDKSEEIARASNFGKCVAGVNEHGRKILEELGYSKLQIHEIISEMGKMEQD